MRNAAVDRLRELPQEPGTVWQGGFARFPAWVDGSDAKPFRPLGFLWMSVQTGILGPVRDSVIPPEEREPRVAVETLIRFATHEMGGRRPVRLEVDDADVAAYLSDSLQGLDIAVVHRAHLVMWESELRSLWKMILERDPLPGYLDGKDVTVERVRAFAEAAQAFHAARPWRYLSNEDLIRLECPRPSRAPRYAIVLGAGGHEFGVTLCRSVDDFWSYQGDSKTYSESVLENGVWSVTFSRIPELPLADADLWEDHALPIDDEQAYPLAAQYYPARVRRPGAQMLAFFEAILRALAATREEELVRGRWTRRVATFDGDVEVTLTLPLLLDPPSPSELAQHGFFDRRSIESFSTQVGRFLAGKDFSGLDEIDELLQGEFVNRAREERVEYPPRTPLEEAQDLCYEAFGSIGYRRVVLARRALEISRDCADAYVLLAEASGSPQEQAALYAAGVDAGRRALGDTFFAEPPEHAWGRVNARPAMRAMQGLAYAQAELGRVDEAIAGYQELLRINPDDNQGIRYLLLPMLIVNDQYDEAREIIAEYADAEAVWLYARALLGFRVEGDATGPRRIVRKAIRQAPHVAELLLGADEIDELVSRQEEEDTFFFADVLESAWNASEGALDWLASQRDAVRS